MKKPATVHPEAEWKYDGWHKGILTKKGIPIGTYTVWDETGNLFLEGDFDQSGNINWLKTYYPDGSIGRDISYDKVSKTTKVQYRSYQESFSRLITPLSIGAKGYAEKIYEGKVSINNPEISNGSPEGVSFYNEQGEYMSTFKADNYSALIEKHTLADPHETWPEALERLNNFWLDLQALYAKDDLEIENDYFTVSFDKSVTPQALAEAEARLGVHFPTSYKEFVLHQGVIKFGENQGRFQNIAQRMLLPHELQHVEHVLDPQGQGYFENDFELSKESRKKIICFFEDQTDIQYEGWGVFDFTQSDGNEVNVILEVGCKNIDAWETKVGKPLQENANAMDRFISSYVNRLIAEREP